MGAKRFHSPTGPPAARALLCFAIVLSMALLRTPCSAENVLMVAGDAFFDPGSYNGEHGLQSRLEKLGHTVTSISDAEEFATDPYDLLIVLGSASPSKISSRKCHLLDIPLWVCGAGLLEEWFGLEVTESTVCESVRVTDFHHYITSKLGGDEPIGYSICLPHPTVSGGTLGDGTPLARFIGLQGSMNVALLVYDKDQATPAGDTMPARRVLLPFLSLPWNHLTENGWLALERSIEWSLGRDSPIVANAGADQQVYYRDYVLLDGSRSFSRDAPISSYRWEQIIQGSEPRVHLATADPPDGSTAFTPPYLHEYVVTLHFRLTVAADGVEDTDEVIVTVRRDEFPSCAEITFWTRPLHLGAYIWWEPVLGDEVCAAGWPGWCPWPIYEPPYSLMNLAEGESFPVSLRFSNGFGDAECDPIWILPLRNLALPDAGENPTPPSKYVYAHSRYSLAQINDGVYDNGSIKDHTDSRTGVTKREDYWGYMWNEPLFFSHVVYYTGRMSWDGGWFTRLTVQYTEDGITWKRAPNVSIDPSYNFANTRTAHDDFVRYDLSFSPVRGRGIRIHGTPGGVCNYTSVSELEVYGDQNQGSLVVYGLDKDAGERFTAVLDASHSFSTRGPIISYRWEQLAGPPVTIADAAAPVTSFDAPGVDQDTVCIFLLTAGDGTEEASDEVTITIRNLVTTAVAGRDRSALEGSAVTLDGTGSYSTSGTLIYHWTQTSGIPVMLSNPDFVICSFFTPFIWDYAEELTFRLDVDDGIGGARSDEVTVEVRNALAWPAWKYTDKAAPTTGYITDLLHLGDYPTDRIVDPLDVNGDPLVKFGGQAFVNPVPGEEYDFNGTDITATRNPMIWTPIHNPIGWFGNEPVENFQQFYHVCLISPDERPARLHFRHNDAFRIWNNGTLLVSRDAQDAGNEKTEDFTLEEGINSLTFKLGGEAAPNYFAVGITNETDEPFDDLHCSLGPSFVLPDVYVIRELPESYDPGTTLEVQFTLRVNPDHTPLSVTVTETIPPDLMLLDPGGGLFQEGTLTWTFDNGGAATQVICYCLEVPADISGGLSFHGTVSFEDTTDSIRGDNVVYEPPSAPERLDVEMLLAAHLMWEPSPEEGVIGYRIYRSVNGGPWQSIASVPTASYEDRTVVQGNSYNYKVSAVTATGVESPLSEPSGEKTITMKVREAEDFNYGGGQYPGRRGCPAAIEATYEDDLSPYNDYFFEADGTNEYRPLDSLTIQEIASSGHAISSTSAGDWWRYTFDVPPPDPSDPGGGWVKLVFSVASLEQANLAAYWDEALVGEERFATGSFQTYDYIPMEAQVQSTPGVHTLRVTLASGSMRFDAIGIGFNWSRPTRETIFEDDFDDYSSFYGYDDLVAAGWTVINGSGDLDAAWRLWNTAADPLGNEDPALEGMTDNYMITDSDLAPFADMDEQLITPEIDCSCYERVRLDFNKNYRVYPNGLDHLQIAEVDIRFREGYGCCVRPPVFPIGCRDSLSGEVNDWSDWKNLVHYDRTMVAESDAFPEQVDISLNADGNIIQLRWRFYDANYDYWFAIDDVRVSGKHIPLTVCPPEPPPCPHGFLWVVAPENCDFVVEYCVDLSEGNWMPLPGQTWPQRGEPGMVICLDTFGARQGFYRIAIYYD